jgi:hypothetical protein
VRCWLQQRDVCVGAGGEPVTDLVIERHYPVIDERGKDHSPHRLRGRANLEVTVQRAFLAQLNGIPPEHPVDRRWVPERPIRATALDIT